MSKKFLVAVQYWEGDRASAIGLMELLARTVEHDNQWADFVVYHRFDCEPPPIATVRNLERAFSKVYVLKGAQQIIGYPDGCNALWSDLVMKAFRFSTESNRGAPPWAEYKAVLAIESDTCPLSDNWLEVISKEWDAHDVAFMGAWDKSNADHPLTPELGHINGNAMFAMDLARRVPMCMGTPYQRAWDTYHAPGFKAAGWLDTKTIRSWFRHKTLTKAEYTSLIESGCVLLHGIKNDSVRELYLVNGGLKQESPYLK